MNSTKQNEILKSLKMRHILYLFFVLSNFTAFSQSVTILGTVIDLDNNPIEFANVTINSVIDSSIVKFTDTDSSGYFSMIGVVPGDYFIGAYMVGYSDYFQPIQIKKDVSVELQLDISTHLAEIEVVSRRPTVIRKPDRLIFNIKNSIVSSNGDASGVLNALPRITVDDNSVSILGKGDVLVLYNDKLMKLSGSDLTNFLKSIPSEDIEAIEVMKNPPAKYDAEGDVGLINIRTSKSVNYGLKGGGYLGYDQGQLPIGFMGGNLRYGNGKFGVFGSINHSLGNTRPLEYLEYTLPDSYFEYTLNRKDYTNNLSYNFGADIDMSDKSSLSLQYIGSQSKPDIAEDIEQIMFSPNSSGRLDSIQYSTAYNNRNNNLHQVNLNYRLKMDTLGGNVNFSGDVLKYTSENARLFSNSIWREGIGLQEDSVQVSNESLQDILGITFQSDFEQTLKNVAISYGGKVSFVKISNNVKYLEFTEEQTTLVPELSDDYVYNENTQALYFSLEREWENWGFQTGLRAEYTQIDGVSQSAGNFENSYLKFFPTIYLQYAINESHLLGLSYGRRIGRPTYWDLNPFRWTISPNTYSTGNPTLGTSFNNNLSLEYSINDSYYITVSGSYAEDAYYKISQTDINENIVTTPQNIGDFLSYGVDFTAYHEPTKWWETENSIWVDRYNLVNPISDSYLREDSYEQFAVGYYSGNNFYFGKSKKVSGEFNAQILFPGAYEGVYKLGGVYKLNMGIRTKILDGKGLIFFSCNDILHRMFPSTNAKVGDLNLASFNTYDTRRFKLQFRYNFGINDSKILNRRKKISNSEEKGRL